MRHIHERWVEAAAIAGCAAFALAILFPAAGLARGWGKAEVCMVNLQILGRAWLAYSEDFDGRLVGGSNYYNGTRGTPYRWVERPLYSPTDNPEKGVALPSSSEYTLEYRRNGIRAGKLYPYVQDTQAYHCPADQNWVQKTPQNQAYRSYSIGGLMNGEDFLLRSGSSIYGSITVYRTITMPNGTSKQLIVAEKMSQIRRPRDKFVFVEEDAFGHQQAENVGSFILMQNSHPDYWWDWPAAFHPDRWMLGFADGHAAGYVWKDSRTDTLMRTGNWNQTQQPNNPDLQWMEQGYMPAEP